MLNYENSDIVWNIFLKYNPSRKDKTIFARALYAGTRLSDVYSTDAGGMAFEYLLDNDDSSFIDAHFDSYNESEVKEDLEFHIKHNDLNKKRAKKLLQLWYDEYNV